MEAWLYRPSHPCQGIVTVVALRFLRNAFAHSGIFSYACDLLPTSVRPVAANFVAESKLVLGNGDRRLAAIYSKDASKLSTVFGAPRSNNIDLVFAVTT